MGELCLREVTDFEFLGTGTNVVLTLEFNKCGKSNRTPAFCKTKAGLLSLLSHFW